MSEVKLAAKARSEFGKGAARRLRRAQLVPAVLYGHGSDPIHISLPAHETGLALRVANALLSIEVDGGAAQLALPKQVQRDPVKNSIEHLDLVIVRRGEKVTVEVPLLITGEVKGDATIVTDQTSIMIEAEATNIPAHIEIDVTDMEIGDQVLAADLKLPEGSVFPGEPDDLILAIHAAAAVDLGESPEVEPEVETEAEAAAAEE